MRIRETTNHNDRYVVFYEFDDEPTEDIDQSPGEGLS